MWTCVTHWVNCVTLGRIILLLCWGREVIYSWLVFLLHFSAFFLELYSFEWVTERRKDGQGRGLRGGEYLHLLFHSPQLSQTKTRNQKLHLGLQCGWQRPLSLEPNVKWSRLDRNMLRHNTSMIFLLLILHFSSLEFCFIDYIKLHKIETWAQ